MWATVAARRGCSCTVRRAASKGSMEGFWERRSTASSQDTHAISLEGELHASSGVRSTTHRVVSRRRWSGESGESGESTWRRAWVCPFGYSVTAAASARRQEGGSWRRSWREVTAELATRAPSSSPKVAGGVGMGSAPE
jgi:hypothetical protein